MIKLPGLILAAACLICVPAEAQPKKKPLPTEINYSIEVVEGVTGLRGINRHGELAAVKWSPNDTAALFLNRQDKTVEFDCPATTETVPEAINNDGTITGYCFGGSGDVGFTRKKGGRIELLSVPGSDHTLAFGINDFGHIVGEFWNPFTNPNDSGWTRHHSFVLKKGQYETLSVPLAVGPNQRVITQANSINRHGQIVGNYFTVTLTDNTQGPTRAFFYDNGTFSDLSVPGYPDTHALYINNAGQVILWANGFHLSDDDHFYRINAPAGYNWSWIDGIDDFGRLVGTLVQPAQFPTPSTFFHVIATPVN